jgi:catechol 2,3-dioxygenase-like lactoylglutathione lyase family enzyme
MKKMTVKLPPLHHVGIVVADLEAAAEDYRRRWGVETVDVAEMTFSGVTYEGREIAALTATYGFVRTGASEIEFIQPGSRPSPYADFLERNGGDGLHHLAYVVERAEPYLEQLAEAGAALEILLDAPLGAGRGRFIYVDGVAHGPAVELIELSEGQREDMAERNAF